MAIRANNIELISGSVGELGQVSSSQRIGTVKLDPNDLNSFMISSSQGGDLIYLSGSGRIGFNTDDPQSGLDAVVDEVQFQRPGTRKGLKINQDGNIESFDKDPTTAATGSEFLLRFSRGTAVTKASLEAIGLGPFADDAAAQAFFNGLNPPTQNSILEKIEVVGFIDPPQVGDTLGSIRWVAESGSISGYDDRSTGETAVLKAVVSGVDSDGIRADLIFSVADKTGAAQQKLLLDADNEHQVTGSLNIGSSIRLKGFIQPASDENDQTRIDFSNSGVDIDFYSNTTQVLKLSNTGIIFNELSNDVDLRIEGNGDANLFVTNAGTDKVGIGTNTPGEKLTVEGNISASGNIIGGIMTSQGNNVISQSGAFTNNEFIVAVGTSAVTSSDALAVDSDGNLGIGTPNPEVRLHMLGESSQTTQILMEQFNDNQDAPDIRTRRYRGTSASRADVQTGDYLFRLNVHGQDGGSSELYGSMRFDVDSSDQDALEWGLQTRDTAGTVADRLIIDANGNFTASGEISSTINGGSF